MVYVQKIAKDKDGMVDKAVSDSLYMISRGYQYKSERDEKNENIRALFKEGFQVKDPTGTKKIGSKVIQQVIWRSRSKFKFLDFQIHGVNKKGEPKSQGVEKLMSDGVRTVADKGRLMSNFRDKGGMVDNLSFYGDTFLEIGKDENSSTPIEFKTLKNESVYVDDYAYGIRGTRPAYKLTAIYQYDKSEAYDLFPELKDAGIYGRISGSYEMQRGKETDQENILEIAKAYNISTQQMCLFAGSQAYKIKMWEGEEYPYMKMKEPYIPVIQFICQPSVDQFYNYGIADMIYDLAIMQRRLFNAQTNHTFDSTDPLAFVSGPEGSMDDLMEKMAYAYKMRAQGKKPMIPLEYGAGGAGSNQVGVQSLLTNSLANEWQMMWETFAREISRLGINIDDLARGGNVTASQVIAEEEASNAFVKQIMENNASETQELIEIIMDSVTQFVPNSNKELLQLTTKIPAGDGTFVSLPKGLTMGGLSQELKNGENWCYVNSRTGTIPSDLMKITQLQRQMGATAPGSPEYQEIYQQMAYYNDIELAGGGQPQPENLQGGAPSDIPEGIVPAGTERIQTNPRQAVPQPI